MPTRRKSLLLDSAWYHSNSIVSFLLHEAVLGLPILLRQSARCNREFDDGMIGHISTKPIMFLQSWLTGAECIFNKWKSCVCKIDLLSLPESRIDFEKRFQRAVPHLCFEFSIKINWRNLPWISALHQEHAMRYHPRWLYLITQVEQTCFLCGGIENSINNSKDFDFFNSTSVVLIQNDSPFNLM
jgi:hypothetical protein